MLTDLMAAFASGDISAYSAGVAAQKYAREHLQPEQVARELLRKLDRFAGRPIARAARRPAVRQRLLGFNAVGSWSTSSGIAEAARRSVIAAIGAGMAVALEERDVGAARDEKNVPAALRRLPAGRPFPVDVCYLNINEIQCLTEEYLPMRRRPRRLLASWWWELPTLPTGLLTAASRLNPGTVIVGSAFVRDMLAFRLECPVHTVPPVVAVVPDMNIGRARFGLPEGVTIYLTSLDAHSGLRRKNPLGVVEAFRRAFPKQGSGALLVVKTESSSLLSRGPRPG